MFLTIFRCSCGSGFSIKSNKKRRTWSNDFMYLRFKSGTTNCSPMVSHNIICIIQVMTKNCRYLTSDITTIYMQPFIKTRHLDTRTLLCIEIACTDTDLYWHWLPILVPLWQKFLFYMFNDLNFVLNNRKYGVNL